MQVAFAASVPPVSVTVAAPATPLGVAAGQVVARFGVAAIVIPAGNASETARPVSADGDAPVLAIVMVRVDVPLGAMTVGENVLVKVTLVALLTTSVAVAGATLLMPSVDVSAADGMVLR